MKKAEKQGSNTKEWLKFGLQLAVVAGVSMYVFKNIFIPVQVEGNSMYPTLEDANAGFVNGMDIAEGDIKRFDIVVLYSSVLDKKIVKRVIGLPGDTIEYKEDQLYVNGELQKEEFLNKEYVQEAKEKYHSNVFTKDFKTTVESGHIFVLGDNRLNSRDSREFGSFSYGDVIGKKGIILYPPNSIHWME